MAACYVHKDYQMEAFSRISVFFNFNTWMWSPDKPESGQNYFNEKGCLLIFCVLYSISFFYFLLFYTVTISQLQEFRKCCWQEAHV